MICDCWQVRNGDGAPNYTEDCLACGTNKKANIENAAAKIAAASKQGAEIIVLPECFNSPYGTKYFPEYAENVIEGGQSETALMLSTAARDNKVFIVGGSFPEKEGEKIYNSCYIFNRDGDMVARHRKVHLFDIDIPGKITFKESDTLSPGDCPTIVDLSEHGGPPVRMGIGICYDIRFPELALLYRHLGCSMLVYPGAFNMVTGPAHWELLLRARAVDTQSFGIVCSPARDESADYIAWGHSMIVDPWGEKLGELQEKEDILMVDLDLTQLAKVVSRRQNMPYWLQRRQDIYKLSSPFMPEKKPSPDK
ncbi:hypothetical protein GUITHDRAFT_99169 [Guillardia theta CCMP2712]|uniref:CN hydrolase domain-containing protein n=1 Tax=Guillardia theta (strain CCMP2712) TaxID=905079 RepID=L1K3K8_GUITC|nr:hypothetical protein GUITHDRAFT_99169 [Guillardia theta CCMP2712]EKX55386.1 hypothetical protein GUITHDRAFT_99169 [Guillardia theta CCMP2712]|eukprot:XP_005842366.1 hypothetical protein GUITHDRAFT_99169 [Guillardia theta CCMP2712]